MSEDEGSREPSAFAKAIASLEPEQRALLGEQQKLAHQIFEGVVEIHRVRRSFWWLLAANIILGLFNVIEVFRCHRIPPQ
jgi:hypothetical protein